MNQIEKKVLKKITPTDEYRKKVNVVINDLEKKIETEIESKKIPADLTLVGSIAKDTYLKNNMDIDFFIRFPTNFKKQNLAKYSRIIGKKLLKNTEESYAEHPYIRGYYKEFLVEIVPCYKIENASQKLSAVDRTPLHTDYIIKNITEKQKDEVRLFKQFLKGIGCYGAESQIQGFSGYLCEIMILYFKDFKNIIKNAKDLKYNQKLSLRNKKSPDFNTPLVFIDPVDNNRNVASALSMEKFKIFKLALKNYNKNPNINFFFPKKVKAWSIDKIKNQLKQKDFKYIAIRVSKPDIIDENLYPQIRKALKSIIKISKEYDFKILDNNFYIDKYLSYIYFIFKTKKESLPKTKIHIGPPLKLDENAKEFNEKWKKNKQVVKGPYIDNERLKVEIKRKYRELRSLLESEIKNISLGKHLENEFIKSYKVIENNDLLISNLRIFWTEYFEDKHPWDRN